MASQKADFVKKRICHYHKLSLGSERVFHNAMMINLHDISLSKNDILQSRNDIYHEAETIYCKAEMIYRWQETISRKVTQYLAEK